MTTAPNSSPYRVGRPRQATTERNHTVSENITPAAPLTPTLRERIEAGAAWLDEVKPEWRDLIDLDVLDVGDGRYCVLGQVFDNDEAADYYNGYDYAYNAVVPEPEPDHESDQPYQDWLNAHAFDVDLNHVAYATLTEGWLAYLRETGE